MGECLFHVPVSDTVHSGLPCVGYWSGLPCVGYWSGLPCVGYCSGLPCVGYWSGLPRPMIHVLVSIEDAFLRQPDYVEAMITCLQAIEQNKASLLADVSPALVSASLECSVILMYRSIYDPTVCGVVLD